MTGVSRFVSASGVTVSALESVPAGSVMERAIVTWSVPSIAKPAPGPPSVKFTVNEFSAKPPREKVNPPRSVADWPGSGCTVTGSVAMTVMTFCCAILAAT